MHVRLATRQDISDIATVASKAMMTDELSIWLSPDQHKHPHLHRERCLNTTKRRWNSGMTMLVAVLDERDQEWNGVPQVVGYAAYEKKVGAEDDSSKRQAGALERYLHRINDDYIWYFRHNLGTIKSRSRQLEKILTNDQSLTQFPRFWELDFLAVDPAFGRRGIGAELIDWGQQRATEDGVPLLLWASAMGYPLYLRKGFESCGMLDFCEDVKAPTMVWWPARVEPLAA